MKIIILRVLLLMGITTLWSPSLMCFGTEEDVMFVDQATVFDGNYILRWQYNEARDEYRFWLCFKIPDKQQVSRDSFADVSGACINPLRSASYHGLTLSSSQRESVLQLFEDFEEFAGGDEHKKFSVLIQEKQILQDQWEGKEHYGLTAMKSVSITAAVIALAGSVMSFASRRAGFVALVVALISSSAIIGALAPGHVRNLQDWAKLRKQIDEVEGEVLQAVAASPHTKSVHESPQVISALSMLYELVGTEVTLRSEKDEIEVQELVGLIYWLLLGGIVDSSELAYFCSQAGNMERLYAISCYSYSAYSQAQ